MATLTIEYNLLDKVSKNAANLSEDVAEYSGGLSNKILNKIDDLTGGINSNISSAQYYVNNKIKQINSKKESFKQFSTDVISLVGNAKRIDQEVATKISLSHDTFLNNNEHLRIEGWKAELLNWLVDLKNKCPVLEMIGNAVRNISSYVSEVLDNIKYWYKCEGGKETLAFITAIGGAVLSVIILIATFPASAGFVAICAFIGAIISTANAITNVITSFSAMRSAKNGDPAWAKIYGDQNKLSDVIRQTKFKTGLGNRLSYAGATILDCTQLFCGAVSIVHMATQIKSKFNFIKNYFDKNTGLLSYCKTVKWTDGPMYDEMGNVIGTKKVMEINDIGTVETKFTPSSIWRGLKAFALDKPIDCKTDAGIRTLLNQNFKIDFKDWKNSFSFQGVKDTIRYNFKNNSFKGATAKGMSWSKRKGYIKTSAKEVQSGIKTLQKMETFAFGEKNIIKQLENSMKSKVKNFSDIGKIFNKTSELSTDSKNIYENSYEYRQRNYILEGK